MIHSKSTSDEAYLSEYEPYWNSGLDFEPDFT